MATRKRKAPAPEETPPIIDETVDADGGETLDAEAAEAEIEAEIPTGVRGRAQRLADRIKGMINGTHDDADEEPVKRKALTTKRSEELGAHLCVLLAMLMCWLIDAALAQPYKPVAPTPTEAQAITAPISRIIARRLKAAGKIGPDTLDYLMLITAIGFYADRARQTSREITQALFEERVAYEETHRSAPLGPQPPSATDGASGAGRVSRPSRPTATHAGGGNVSKNHSGSGAPDGQPIDPMDALLAADAAGRAKRGLI